MNNVIARFFAFILFLTFSTLGVFAQVDTERDSTTVADGVTDDGDELHPVRKVVRGFSKIDKNYIEPQHYNFTVMAQLTNTYDVYTLTSASGHTVTLAPDVRTKIGPYFGWRWFFLGYTFDVKSLGLGSSNGKNGKKTELEFSIYSSKIGIDLYYRRTGSDYKIRDVWFGDNIDVSKLNGTDFDGINVSITGFNLYYIFNSKKFSYPAAFSQSTIQKRSQGSWMAGVGYLRNSLDFDYDKFNAIVQENVTPALQVDSGLMFSQAKHYDYYVSGGYAYNWVFAKNWLFSAGFSLALAYKHNEGDMKRNALFRSFSVDDIHVDGIWRLGLVYNNMRWYGGISSVIRSYNYENDRFKSNNTLASVNFYLGYNFGLKDHYKRKKTTH